MFAPLFKKTPNPEKTKEKSCGKTAAPLDLVRKIAFEEGPTKEERLQKNEKAQNHTVDALAMAKSRAMGLGALGGAVAGGIGGHLMDRGVGAVPGVALGALGGATLGAAVGGGKKGKALSEKLDALKLEKKQLSAMAPGTRGPLTAENLDREGYQQSHKDLISAKSDYLAAVRPVAIGSVVGAGLGALGGYLTPGQARPLMRAAQGSGFGSMAGAIGGGFFTDKDRLEEAAKRYDEIRDKRRDIWEGASTLVDQSKVATIKAVASKLAFEDLTAPREKKASTDQIIFESKLSAVEDEELFKVACGLATYANIDGGHSVALAEALDHYEDLGGKYKAAFGAPMFNDQQMSGSPALAGGMARRATTPMPALRQAQPQQSPAASSPKTQAGSITPQPSMTAQTPAPSTAPATSVAAPSVSMG